MQEKYSNQYSDNEVALGHFTGRVSGFFESVLNGIFNFIQLLYRNKWITLTLIVIGVALGILQTVLVKPKFKSEIIVASNFNSNEYLYSTVKNFSAMKSAAVTPKDSILLTAIDKIEVEPVYNAFDFLLSNYQRMEAFKILSERGIDIEKYLKSKIAEKSYRYHKITVVTQIKPDSTDLVINNFLEKINQTSYFKQRMQFEKVNLSAKRDQLQRSVDQLNGMFESFGKTPVSGSTVTSNDYSDMDKLFMSKEYLLDQINLIDAELLESDKVIFDVFRTVNKSVGFFVPPFIYLPLLFVLLFSIFVNLKNKYKKFTTK
ncbi:hypothetical protein NU10_13320 [Flavobacterium dauae]|uniref:hypothetical protein n=1 Tax=Flavobacterium dauae TaxID=1563479 RepID=UPI00101B4897|nr:hypothetical protein [Flavobacterium dauae]WLD23669.1 hypothetical protein NU10_13320 [Flavobacterium dauae]